MVTSYPLSLRILFLRGDGLLFLLKNAKKSQRRQQESFSLPLILLLLPVLLPWTSPLCIIAEVISEILM